MVASVTATLGAARFGLAPSVAKRALGGNGLKLKDGKDVSQVITNDPAGETNDHLL